MTNRGASVIRATNVHRQQGIVLLALLLLFGIVGMAVLVTIASPSSRNNEMERRTSAAFVEARDALLGRAAMDTDRPGSLPCPDTDDDGLENWTGNACTSYIGRLPWMTLGIDVRDASGERLWYALSANFRDDAAVQPLNSDSAGSLTINGTSPASAIAAILIAPGEVRGTQVRSSANVNDVTQYLEGENNNGDLIYTTAIASATFNDRLLPITTDTLFNVVAVRVAKEMQNSLESYRATNGYYPFANSYTAGLPYVCQNALQNGRIPLSVSAGCPGLAEWGAALPAWFSANNWNLLTHYGMDNTCALSVTSTTTAGCTVVIVTGRARGGQPSPCGNNLLGCFEDAENSNGDDVYVKPSRYPAGNDRMAVKCSLAAPCPAVP